MIGKDVAETPAPRHTWLVRWGGRAGLVLLCGAALAWAVSFPALPALWGRIAGGGAPLTTWGPDILAQQYPQLIVYGFVLGTLLWFGLRPPAPAATPPPTRRWLSAAWRYGPIGALGGILALATYERAIVPLTMLGPNIVPTDYDEGLLAEATLLSTNGAAIYKDFLFDQPPTILLLLSLPLRFGHSAYGDIHDLLRMRLFTVIISLITIAIVYLIGRRLAGPIAGLVAAFVLAVDGAAQRYDQRLIFEPFINLFLALMLLAFLHAERGARGWRRGLPLLLAGLCAGVAITVKIPAVVGPVALVLTLLCGRRWRDTLVFSASTVIGFLPITAWFLFSAGAEYIKQVYIQRIIEPVNSVSLAQHSDDVRLFGFLYRIPYVHLTLLLAVIGLCAIVLRWARARESADRWLPVVLLAFLTFYLYSSKAGFSRHYYAQLVLPLALLAGGVVLLWPRRFPARRWLLALCGGAALLTLWLVAPFANTALHATVRGGDQPLRAARALHNLNLPRDGTLYSWNSSYAFVSGHPLPRDQYQRYNVDNSAYALYLALGLDRADLPQALGWLVNPPALPHPYTDAPAFQTVLRAYTAETRVIFLQADQEGRFDGTSMAALNRRYALRLNNGNVAIYTPISHLHTGPQSAAITFVGYEGDIAQAKAGRSLPITLYLRATTGRQDDAVAAISLLDNHDQVVAYSETAPPGSDAAKENWKITKVLYDRQSVTLPAALPPGTYRVRVDFLTPTPDASGPSTDLRIPALHADLGTVRIS